MTTPGMFRLDRTTLLSTSAVMTTGLPASRAFRKPCMVLVFTSSSFRPSTTSTLPAAALADRADFRASRRVFLFRLVR